MAPPKLYRPRYTGSRALVVGINGYQYVAPLQYARQDAEAIAAVLQDRFGFPPANVTLLLDRDATRSAIRDAYMTYTRDPVEEDDRVLIFYAGHGHTHSTSRREIGFLIPSDGDPNRLESLIRWEELTTNSELIAAKHILFVMDACYGGLAVQRAVRPGSTRFLRDMLMRYSRQVLTAGKGDETVSDAGGPRLGHSVFTGHLLNALSGEVPVSNEPALLTANQVMSYVYERVSRDVESRQTPHFGFIDGDGDFVFLPIDVAVAVPEAEEGTDAVIEVSATAPDSPQGSDSTAFRQTLKAHISEPTHRIALDDAVTGELRSLLATLNSDGFATSSPDLSPSTFAERLKLYERAISRLEDAAILLGRWAIGDQVAVLEKIIIRVAEHAEVQSGGLTLWLALRWYPLVRVTYAAGIAALSGGSYANIARILGARVIPRFGGDSMAPVVIRAGEAAVEFARTGAFKTLPGHERYYAPYSEYLFRSLQPGLDELMFLGRSYDALFDRFEVLSGLTHIDLEWDERRSPWCPMGRFAWKQRRGQTKPVTELIREVETAGSRWPGFEAGLFGGSVDRFKRASEALLELIAKLHWL